MPFRTRYGTHYHESQGCSAIAGKTVMPCSTDGLTPCSICCKGTKGDSGGGAPASGTTVRSGGREVHVDGDVIETRSVGAGFSTMSDGTLYRLDRHLSSEEAAALDALPGVTFMPDEMSLDRTQKSSAFIVNDHAAKSGVEYARDLGALGVRAMTSGASMPAGTVPEEDVRAWLAATGDGDWRSMTVHGLHMDESAEPVHEPAGDGWPAHTFYPFEGDVTMRELAGNQRLNWFVQNDPHVRYGTRGSRGGLVVDEGHDLVFRNTSDGVRMGVRRHYDTPVLTDMRKAEWKVDRRTRRGDVVSSQGVAYRTPAGDATIRMTISPDPMFPGRVRTTVRVHDPFLDRTITLVQDDSSESLDYAKERVCGHALKRANKGTETREIEREYEQALPKLAAKDAERDGMVVERVTPVGRNEVEIIALAGGYEPTRLRYMYGSDNELQRYVK